MTKKEFLKDVTVLIHDYIYKMERKTHTSFLRGWDVSDKR